MRIQAAAAASILALGTLAPSPAAAQGTDKAAQVVAAARQAIGDRKLDELKTLSVEASVQRNMSSMQMTSDLELLLELPDKYLRSEQMNMPGGMMGGGSSMGF